MATKIFSCSFSGLNCQIIEVQADISNGLPTFSIVGLGDISVQESKERVRSSIKNSGFTFPPTKKTVNLAPAQVRKQGSLFDFPIAVSLLIESDQLKPTKIENSILIGELSLNGDIKKVNGALLITQHAKEQGFKKIFLPKENAYEASFIKGIEIYPIESLREFVKFCQNLKLIKSPPYLNFNSLRKASSLSKTGLFSKIVGHDRAKRAFLIGAAGRHNILLHGSPGSGKTVLARAFSEILPEMNQTETLETTKIYSIAGLLDPETPIILNRPFREIHHTASAVSIVGGGGASPRPGEISLAHNGVLFFDEIAEFSKQVLESLRQPLEDKFINITRATFSAKFPSNFVFIATMNPCACGYKNDKRIRCVCTDGQIRNYHKKLSGPILDRFDIFLDIPQISMKKIFYEEKEIPENNYEKMIASAIGIQQIRFKNLKDINANCDMTVDEVKEYCQLNKEAGDLLMKASRKLRLSNRGYLRTLKIARTIADLENSENIKIYHLAEAIQYRKQT